jgi:acyl-CoA synthetase (AMP-forming)/AMP-acid ligase II
MRHNSGRNNIAMTLRATIVLLGLASVGYVVVVLAEHSAPSLLNAISQSALESQMMSLDADYFPNGYVNQATKIEDPIATF